MKREVPWLAAMLIVGCLALGIFSLRERSEVSRVNEAGEAAARESQAQIASLQNEIGSLKNAKAEADKKIAEMAQGSAAAQNPSGGKVIHLSDIFKDHPEYVALYEKQVRHNVDRMYGNGLSTLGLPPDQLAKLKDLLVERQMSALDATQAAQAAGLVPGSPAWQTATLQATQDLNSQIALMLGSNAEGTLAQLRQRVYIQNQVQNSYAPDFADAGAPLNPDQTIGLINAMADANYAGKDTSTRPANYNIADPTTGLSPHDDRIINNATPALTPAQVQLLTKDQAENEQIAAIMKAYSGNGPPPIVVP